MAAGLMRKIAGDTIDVYSAGTQPGDAMNALSAQVLAEVGVDIHLTDIACSPGRRRGRGSRQPRRLTTGPGEPDTAFKLRGEPGD